MTSPYIVVSTSLVVAATVYSFWLSIRVAGRSGRIRERLKKEAPEAWSKLNPIARNWNNGQPGIKFLHKEKLADYPGFEEEVEELRAMERRMLWGIGLAITCIGVVIAGTELLGWQW